MPAFYAHYYFGEEIKKSLDKRYLEVINKYPNEFNIGLQGPDILFFYHSLYKNKVNQFGSFIHRNSASIFFNNAKLINPKFDSPLNAYLLGFICHYAMDSSLHPLVEKYKKICRITHAEIEIDLETKILSMKYPKPSRFKIYNLIDNNVDSSIFKLYSNYPNYNKELYISHKIIKDSIKWMRLQKKLFYAPSSSIIGVHIKLLRYFSSFVNGHYIKDYRDKRCEKYVDKIFNSIEDSIKLALKLIDDYYGKSLLSKENFNKDFLGVKK